MDDSVDAIVGAGCIAALDFHYLLSALLAVFVCPVGLVLKYDKHLSEYRELCPCR
jgi:hypothetical protein